MSLRAELEERQYRLLSALVADAAPPEGFCPRRVAITARGLARKREREALSCWPSLPAGGFAEYAAAHSRPPGGSPVRDGYRYARWRAGQGCPAAQRLVCFFGETETGVARRKWLGRGWTRLALWLNSIFRSVPPPLTVT